MAGWPPPQQIVAGVGFYWDMAYHAQRVYTNRDMARSSDGVGRGIRG